MIAMSPSIVLKGSYKFSMKKLVAGGEMSQSTYTGPGELLLAPPMLGDITSLRLAGRESWSVSHDGYLASTQNVVKDYKRQGLGKAMFSGEGLWVYKISGTGLLWLTSFGAIIRKDVGSNSLALSSATKVTDVKRSWRMARSTLLTMAISWLGTLNTFWNVSLRAASSPVLRLAKDWCASSPDPAPSLFRRETRYVPWYNSPCESMSSH